MKTVLVVAVVSMLVTACGMRRDHPYVGTQEYTEWVIENGR